MIKRYFLSFIVFNLLLSIAPLAVHFIFNYKDYLIPGFWYVFGTFAAIGLLFYIIGTWGTGKKDKTSIKIFAGGTTVKFLLWMMFVFFYLRIYSVNGTVFLLNFFYLYLFNSVFEVYSLITNLRNQNQR